MLNKAVGYFNTLFFKQILREFFALKNGNDV